MQAVHALVNQGALQSVSRSGNGMSQVTLATTIS